MSAFARLGIITVIKDDKRSEGQPPNPPFWRSFLGIRGDCEAVPEEEETKSVGTVPERPRRPLT